MHHGPKVPQKLFTPGFLINIIISETLSATALDQYCVASLEFFNFSRLWVSTNIKSRG